METVETTLEQTNRAAARRLMGAMRARDYVAMADVLAPDVVINSPITDSFRFRGRDDAITLLKIARDSMHDLEHLELLGAGEVWAQIFRVRVGGRLIEGTDLLRFDDEGHVRELTLFVRPLAGLAAMAAALVPAVGRRRGRPTSIVLRMLTAPLAVLTRYGDRLATRLLRGVWWSPGRPA